MNGTGIRQFIPNAARPQLLGGFCRAASDLIARTNFSNTRAVTIADRGPSTRGRIIDLNPPRLARGLPYGASTMTSSESSIAVILTTATSLMAAPSRASILTPLTSTAPEAGTR
jgi:hypothetical protein